MIEILNNIEQGNNGMMTREILISDQKNNGIETRININKKNNGIEIIRMMILMNHNKTNTNKKNHGVETII